MPTSTETIEIMNTQPVIDIENKITACITFEDESIDYVEIRHIIAETILNARNGKYDNLG
jgi:hypothetical protein